MLDRNVVTPKEVTDTLWLVKGLRVERSDQYRCAACARMQRAGSWKVWVPQQILKGDPDWAVEEAARVMPSRCTAWCLECAPKYKVRKPPILAEEAQRKPWWHFWR